MVHFFNKDRQFKNVTLCSTLILILTVWTTFLGYIMLECINTINEETSYRIDTLQDNKFEFMWSIIEETYTLATNKADKSREELINKINENYLLPNDSDKLLNDLNNPSDGTVINKIFNEVIKDEYISKNTKHNNMYIAVNYNINNTSSNTPGYIAATHSLYRYNSDRQYYTWDDMINDSQNKELATQAIQAVSYSNINTGMIFKQFNEVPEDMLIKHMSKNELKDMYRKKGLTIFDNIEFMAAAYINKDDDIFGVPNVNFSGLPNNNHKIIVIQDFKAKDILQKYIGVLKEYDYEIKHASKYGINVVSRLQYILFILIFIWLFLIAIIVIIQNSILFKQRESN